ncbi:MAG: hypothetical protein DLM72_02010 [Candidatus Nitrosopolaris wilkensis]|nr:MAG: hypothetical protein DLM72_02010 [Candidatus Nitrosopolaris wilkensis]
MKLIITIAVALAIGVIAAITINHAAAQTANVTHGFIANPSNNNNTDLRTTDPNYNTYQNLALGF